MTTPPPAPPLTREEIAEGRRLFALWLGPDGETNVSDQDINDAMAAWTYRRLDRLLSSAERLAEVERQLAEMHKHGCRVLQCLVDHKFEEGEDPRVCDFAEVLGDYASRHPKESEHE